MINIHKTVLFLVTVQPAQQINKGPGIITADIGPGFEGLFQRINMAAEIVDTRIVNDFTINNRIFCA